MSLTSRQLEILRFVAGTTDARGYPPTLREIGAAFRISSTNGVSDHLKALLRRGVVSRETRRSRTLVVTTAGRVALQQGALP